MLLIAGLVNTIRNQAIEDKALDHSFRIHFRSTTKDLRGIVSYDLGSSSSTSTATHNAKSFADVVLKMLESLKTQNMRQLKLRPAFGVLGLLITSLKSREGS